MAFEKNWDLLAAAAGVEAATAQKIVAHEFPNPTLSLSSTYINVDNHPNSTAEGNGLWDRSYDTIFAINQLFEIGGKRRNRKDSAQAGFEGAKAQFFDARRTWTWRSLRPSLCGAGRGKRACAHAIGRNLARGGQDRRGAASCG